MTAVVDPRLPRAGESEWPERPVLNFRATPLPTEGASAFRAVQEVTGITTRVQERLDAIARRLVGNVPRMPDLKPPEHGGGLLSLTEVICKNAVIRAQHMDRVLDRLEEELS
jgi:hypothetical protein